MIFLVYNFLNKFITKYKGANSKLKLILEYLLNGKNFDFLFRHKTIVIKPLRRFMLKFNLIT